MPKESSGFLLLQQIRDESHRFAITSNRKKKNKSVTRSSLDNINGMGPQKKKSVLKRFKTIQNVKKASVADLAKVNGIGLKLAQLIKEKFD
jgi:excinuclease ABC subunit C